MDFLLPAIAAFFFSAMTLFSGFGLGTLLLPVFALFFPVDLAVAMTAVVHFCNNVFKLIFFARHADRGIVFKFGVPALLSAFAGAALLVWLSGIDPWFAYMAGGHRFEVTPVKTVIAGLIFLFMLLENSSALKEKAFSPGMLPAGGVLSGFFGGLSGHQGAFRSAFLIQCGLSKEAFIGTGVVISCLVDVTRLMVYGASYAASGLEERAGILSVSVAAAFLGVTAGKALMHKVTIVFVHRMVNAFLLLTAALMAAGII